MTAEVAFVRAVFEGEPHWLIQISATDLAGRVVERTEVTLTMAQFALALAGARGVVVPYECVYRPKPKS
jgi:hypothetical protein